jgi:hypothetical protein
MSQHHDHQLDDGCAPSSDEQILMWTRGMDYVTPGSTVLRLNGTMHCIDGYCSNADRKSDIRFPRVEVSNSNSNNLMAQLTQRSHESTL